MLKNPFGHERPIHGESLCIHAGEDVKVADSAYLHVHIPQSIKAKYPQYEQSNDKDFISELVTQEWKQWSHSRKVI